MSRLYVVEEVWAKAKLIQRVYRRPRPLARTGRRARPPEQAPVDHADVARGRALKTAIARRYTLRITIFLGGHKR